MLISERCSWNGGPVKHFDFLCRIWCKMPSVLKKYRLEQGLTQTELAKRVGTSQAQIYRLENSERKLTVEWAERLAKALSTSAKILLFGDTPIRTTALTSVNELPTDAQSIIAECLAFTDGLERQSDRKLSCNERAAYILKFCNIYQETGQLPGELDNLRIASVASSIIYTSNHSRQQANGDNR